MPRPKPVKKTYGIYVSAVVESTKFPALTVLVNGKQLDGGEIRVQELIPACTSTSGPGLTQMTFGDIMKSEEIEVGTAGGQV